MTDQTLAAPELGPEDVAYLSNMAQTEKPPAPVADETTNLAEGMDQAALDKIGALVCEELDQDEEDMAEWQVMHAEWKRLYAQQDKPINPPYDYASEESMPIGGV